MNYITLILSLPSGNATVRMRIWRSLKHSGAAVLNDGVYLLPASCQATLQGIAEDVRAGGGKALVMHVEEPDGENFPLLFDRAPRYAEILLQISSAREALTLATATDTLKIARKLEKSLQRILDIDFFPDQTAVQTQRALTELVTITARLLSADEPSALEGSITRVHAADFHGRLWATRHRPWVDRLASAWLIKRHIDRQARVLWLVSPADCPAEALGFDFDGASFSHVGNKVTFEVLLESFGLEQPGLRRLAAIVHYLDVGGVQPAESKGLESILAGLRESLADDDELLAKACEVFDAMLVHFIKSDYTGECKT
ncbi:MAG: chromate resistance protein [Pseudohongiella sp.]|nr:chromate resistance protein [Pseudohongiella sp.]